MAEFKNPNQQGTPESRSTLLIMSLMVLVFFALQYFRSQHNPQTASPQAPAQTSNHSPAAGLNSANGPHPMPTVAASVAGQTIQVPVVESVAGQAETTTTVENELYKITFSNRGADVRSWILKKYKDSYGKPLDLVHTEAAEKVGYPLSLYTYDDALTANLAKTLFLPSATGNLNAPATLTFRFVSGEYQVTKTFSFDDSYVLHADFQVLHNGAPVRALLSWPGGFGDQETALSYNSAQVDYSKDGHETHEAAKKISGGATLQGNYDWAGVSDLYFASIFLPDAPASTTIATLHNDLIVPKANRHNGLGDGVAIKPNRTEPGKDEVKVQLLGTAVGDASGHSSLRVFAGPKAVGVLRNIHVTHSSLTLEPLLDFGFFGFFGKYLFLALRFIHDHVSGSWGWDIILLTLLINLIILPLRIKTMQSGLKMQRIQPEMDEIKKKYAHLKVTDPKRADMNGEIMELQKREGVNMFGGCIPTLIQLPLLYAFFNMLPKVVELRQAHWAWLPDLSAADPYHILPIFMALSMFLVQFYTPSPGVDPQQQKMMAFMMPAFSFWMTWNYASGLALYWSVGNIISIITQAVMNRTSIGKEMREIAEKRARRKAGLGVAKGRTIQAKAGRR